MSTLRTAKKSLKPVSPTWAWIHYPIWPCVCLKDGHPGVLTIGGGYYDVLPLGPYEAMTFRLRNHDSGMVYDLNLSAPWERCDCGDATFRSERPGGCKHAVAVEQALASIWRDAA